MFCAANFNVRLVFILKQVQLLSSDKIEKQKLNECGFIYDTNEIFYIHSWRLAVILGCWNATIINNFMKLSHCLIYPESPCDDRDSEGGISLSEALSIYRRTLPLCDEPQRDMYDREYFRGTAWWHLQLFKTNLFQELPYTVFPVTPILWPLITFNNVSEQLKFFISHYQPWDFMATMVSKSHNFSTDPITVLYQLGTFLLRVLHEKELLEEKNTNIHMIGLAIGFLAGDLEDNGYYINWQTIMYKWPPSIITLLGHDRNIMIIDQSVQIEPRRHLYRNLSSMWRKIIFTY
jgi:hypothetical protein